MKHETRGRKPKLNQSHKLREEPPAVLSADERKWWRAIRKAVAQTVGTGISAGDESIFVIAARQRARLERLCAFLAKEEVATRDGAGALKVNPLLAEIRATESALKVSLTSLCLTPRARKSNRINQDAQGPAADAADDPVLKLLG